jgi:hypothetical protein
MSASSRSAAALVVGVLIAASLVGATWLVHPRGSPSGGLPPVNYPIASASLGGTNGSVIALDGGFLGVNVRPNEPLTSASASAISATNVRLLRWPGGGNGDRYDPLGDEDRGILYADDGLAAPGQTSLAQFVSVCRAVACDALITLPAEINNTSEAATIVNYTESTLGFYPAYWEIGNEPSLWTHFDLPWTEWNTSQEIAPTPQEYAEVVQSYVRAIRAIDDRTPIIGIGGIGKGASDVSQWFGPTLATDGPNLSAMAVHVYPAGEGFAASNLSGWFGSLTGSGGLPGRAESALATMRTACPACQLSLLADEFQTGTDLMPNTSLSGGYLAAYVGAEIVEALSTGIASLDYYDFQSDGPGAWFDDTGASSASYQLYQGLAAHLGSYALQRNTTAGTDGLLAAEGGSTPSALSGLWLVNTNVTTGFRLNLTTYYPQAADGEAWIFDGPESSPIEESLSDATAGNWTVAPASTAILSGLGAPFPVPGTASEPVRHNGTPSVAESPIRGLLTADPPTLATATAAREVVAAAGEVTRTRGPRRDREVRKPRTGTSV